MDIGKIKKSIIVIGIASFISFYCVYASDIKKADCAGKFYPNNPKRLSSMIESELKQAEKFALGERIYALIGPHAAYQCSAGVAASGFKQLEKEKIDTVILLGPSHHFGFNGIALASWDSFDAVLGQFEVDLKLKSKLVQNLNFVQENDSAFNNEHCLEVQLPFLKTVLGNVKILPVLTGDLNTPQIKELASLLKDIVLRNNILVIASSDLSHYHDYQRCNSIDRNTLSIITSLDVDKLHKGVIDKTVQLCGYASVAVVMEMAKQLNLRSKVLEYSNSGETCSNKKQVVGYSSIAFFYDSNSKEANMLEVFQKKRLLDITRKTLGEFLKTGSLIALDDTDPALLAEKGAFVTLRKNGKLRGCIGNIYPKGALNKTVQGMVVSAATQDPRFSPVEESELGQIEIEISVLSVPKRVNSADDIVLGKHGVIVEKGFNKGVFLPQVAEETGWNKDEFLGYLCEHKAGLKKDAWKDPSVKLFIFEAVVFSERDYDND